MTGKTGRNKYNLYPILIDGVIIDFQLKNAYALTSLEISKDALQKRFYANERECKTRENIAEANFGSLHAERSKHGKVYRKKVVPVKFDINKLWKVPQTI